MMTKKAIKLEINSLKNQLKKTYEPLEQERMLQKIRSLKVYGLMLMDERDENNQRQYTDGDSIYLISDMNRFIEKSNGKIGIESFYAVNEKFSS